MNWAIHHYASVTSTMTMAAGMPLGTVIVADEQTSGLGRHGHQWDSQPDAGLYASFVLEPSPVLTLALGLAVQSAIRSVTSLGCDIRWPNDLMLSERKLGGILVQIQNELAIAGIGINVGQRRFPPEIAAVATSLALETGLDFRRDDLLQAIVAAIPPALAREASAVIALWEEASTWARHKPVQVEIGGRTITGVTAGLDPSGFLRIRKSDGHVELVLAGGVRPL